MSNPHETREAWLTAAARAMLPWFDEAGSPITVSVRLAMGFPSTRALSRRKRVIGECWAASASADGTAEILISPLLDPDNAVEVLGVVVHELAHAALGHGVGHKAPFVKLVRKLGLAGKATATVPGPEFIARTVQVLADLGPLPHARLSAEGRPTKKDGIRQLKVTCEMCGYTARTSRKWLDVGAPLCPTDREPMCEAV